MERMIIKHLSGSKANQVEEFALKHHNELSFGRDTTSVVQFDPDRDDLVGREHARIERDPNTEEGFLLTDLNSTNGTFLNDKKITGTIQVRPGDVVQFGPGGPKFQFDVEPRPKNATKPTRVVETGKSAKPTRVVDSSAVGATAGADGTDSIITKPQTKTSVGKATVERMISHNVSETRQQERSNFAKIGGAAAIAVLLLFGIVIGGGYMYSSWQSGKTQNEIAQAKKLADEKAKEAELATKKLKEGIEKDKASAPKAASAIAEKYSDAVIQIEFAWRLYNPITKEQVYHRYVPTQLVAKIAKQLKQPYNVNAQSVPLYIMQGNTPMPVLIDDKFKSQYDQPIGGVGSGTGFIVTDNGYALTNRHVGAAWKTGYTFPPNTPPGVVINGQGQIVQLMAQPPFGWVPANTVGVSGRFQNTNFQSPGNLVGENTRLQVAFPGKDQRIEAKLSQPSDRHDVAVLRVNKPGSFTKVELHDNYETLKKGEELVVMGYPGMTKSEVGKIESQDILNKQTQYVDVPNPTVTLTSVSNILRDKKVDGEKVLFSRLGDVIQLATGSTGAGNSGGPVFDTQGRVVGIFFAGSPRDDIRYAVPIRYGMKLLE